MGMVISVNVKITYSEMVPKKVYRYTVSHIMKNMLEWVYTKTPFSVSNLEFLKHSEWLETVLKTMAIGH